MTTRDIANLRLVSQQVGGTAYGPVEIVRYMGAMQAQDYYGALWAVGLRTGCTEQEVIKALEAVKILRTWPQRGTLHLVPSEDAKWLVGLSADRLLKGATRRRQQLGLDDGTLVKAKKILSAALSGGKLLPRPKILETLEAAGIPAKGGRGYHILWYLSQTGFTFVGPMAGKQQTYGMLDEAVAKPNNLDREAGIAEVARRYFISHGPATIQDFVRWTGLTVTDARAGLEANLPPLASESVEGKEYWFSKEAGNKQPPRAALLPGFDEFMLGYKDRSAALHADHADKILPGGNGMFLSTIILNGQVVGTWKRTIKRENVNIKLDPFKPLAAADKKLLRAAAEQYGYFLGLATKME
jgi:hypothetical protein